MEEDFIREKDLEYGEDPELGKFWIGVDSYNSMKWELHFEADGDGPKLEQINKYKRFLADFDTIFQNIKKHITPQIPNSIKINSSGDGDINVEIDIVCLKEIQSNADIEIACCFAYRKLIFKKRLFFLASIKDNKVISVVGN